MIPFENWQKAFGWASNTAIGNCSLLIGAERYSFQFDGDGFPYLKGFYD